MTSRILDNHCAKRPVALQRSTQKARPEQHQDLIADHCLSRVWELVAACFGIAAKFELRRIRERTAAGRAAAKAQGVKFGRKPKLTPHQKHEALQRRDVEGEPHRS